MSVPRTNGAVREIALFGRALGGLLAVLHLAEVRFLVVDRRVGLYSVCLALVFAGAGVWLGLSWRRHLVEPARSTHAALGGSPAVEASASFVPDLARTRDLGLTPRELEILESISLGLSNREIAERLFVSENTVKTHASRVFEKLGAKRRTEAVAMGRAQRLIP